MNRDIRLKDLDDIITNSSIDWNKLKNSTVLITGASGLIGSTLTNALLNASKQLQLNIRIIACVRDIERAKVKIIIDGPITYIQGSVEELKEIPSDITFIIHTANPTSSLFFVQKPVETISTAVLGTKNLLSIARNKNVQGFVFLSSMEIYGHPQKGKIISEKDIGSFDPAVVRNCYPLSKLLCESMVTSYASEYSVPCNVVRLTQTFGPGVEYNDTRIFAEFARCVIENKDIILHSNGETERCYLYISDAVSAILTVLLEGGKGQIYTAANSDTYCSIYDMAQMVAHDVADDNIDVKFDIDEVDRGYADTMHMYLNTKKMESLGWCPRTPLKEMFSNMIEDMNNK